MKWKLDKGRPLCTQICERLCLSIADGEFQPHERLLSVRDIAIAAGVNPNTVQRAFETLERQKILYSIRGSGWFVAEDISLAQDVLKQIFKEKTSAYFAEMRTLGLDTEAIKRYVEEWEQ